MIYSILVKYAQFRGDHAAEATLAIQYIKGESIEDLANRAARICHVDANRAARICHVESPTSFDVIEIRGVYE